MRLDIFNVEHGQCSLLTTDQGGTILIDCGHNSTTGWRPSVHLPKSGYFKIDRLFITNSDEDHASDLHNLRNSVQIKSLNRNPTVTSANIMQLKDQDAGLGIQALCSMLDTYNHPLTANTAIDDIVYRNYYNRYPVGFEDENNLSMVTFFDFGRNKVCYTGDMTRKGWLKLMENPAFLAELPSTSIFFASHHGRQDGCCDELYSIGQLKPTITIISDSGIQHATQETVQWYRARSIGFELNGSVRRVLTTRRDGNISMLIAADGAIEVYTQVAY